MFRLLPRWSIAQLPKFHSSLFYCWAWCHQLWWAVSWLCPLPASWASQAYLQVWRCEKQRKPWHSSEKAKTLILITNSKSSTVLVTMKKINSVSARIRTVVFHISTNYKCLLCYLLEKWHIGPFQTSALLVLFLSLTDSKDWYFYFSTPG